MDVYVATSMRRRNEFEVTYDNIKHIFGNPALSELFLRHFDPTNCVAAHPRDKGLTECLMVKCSKVLVYFAGKTDSFGKDAEAAIALSLGKPVIMLCEDDQRRRILQEDHPLTRLININTGVACGALVVQYLDDVTRLVKRIFENDMEYVVKRDEHQRLILKEKLTQSVVRLQTEDKLLSEAFWNNYHNVP